jgi:hypothetical protein
VALVLATTAGCGGAEHGNAQPGVAEDVSVTTVDLAAAGTDTTSATELGRFEVTQDRSDDIIDLRSYEFGDCMAYPHVGPDHTARTVPCDQPHDYQMTRRIDVPDQEEYPAEDAWDALIDAGCAAPAEELIGRPVDPYGRFYVGAIIPRPESWGDGPHHVDCAVGALFTAPGDPYPQLREDLRGLQDQSIHFAAGDCVTSRYPGETIEIEHAVPCDQPHLTEVTGAVEYADAAGPPPLDTPDERCRAIAGAYLGGAIPEPWEFTSYPLHPESWAAGQRYTHCLIAQFDPATGEVVEVTGSPRG